MVAVNPTREGDIVEDKLGRCIETCYSSAGAVRRSCDLAVASFAIISLISWYACSLADDLPKLLLSCCSSTQDKEDLE